MCAWGNPIHWFVQDAQMQSLFVMRKTDSMFPVWILMAFKLYPPLPLCPDVNILWESLRTSFVGGSHCPHIKSPGSSPSLALSSHLEPTLRGLACCPKTCYVSYMPFPYPFNMCVASSVWTFENKLQVDSICLCRRPECCLIGIPWQTAMDKGKP